MNDNYVRARFTETLIRLQLIHESRILRAYDAGAREGIVVWKDLLEWSRVHG